MQANQPAVSRLLSAIEELEAAENRARKFRELARVLDGVIDAQIPEFIDRLWKVDLLDDLQAWLLMPPDPLLNEAQQLLHARLKRYCETHETPLDAPTRLRTRKSDDPE